LAVTVLTVLAAATLLDSEGAASAGKLCATAVLFTVLAVLAVATLLGSEGATSAGELRATAVLGSDNSFVASISAAKA